jgi:hypothetical protein
MSLSSRLCIVGAGVGVVVVVGGVVVGVGGWWWCWWMVLVDGGGGGGGGGGVGSGGGGGDVVECDLIRGTPRARGLSFATHSSQVISNRNPL